MANCDVAEHRAKYRQRIKVRWSLQVDIEKAKTSAGKSKTGEDLVYDLVLLDTT